MKKLIQILTILLIQCLANCTIDVNLSELLHLSKNLIPKECRRLYAVLQSLTYDLPANISAIENTIPKNASCFKLLAKWNSGTEMWEGKGKSHVEIEHRLRQIGRRDLADWLGKAVFYKLASNVIDDLDNYFDDHHTKEPVIKLYKDKRRNIESNWSVVDSALWGLLACLIGMVMYMAFRIIYLVYRKVPQERMCEEMVGLLAQDVDSDQETVFDYNFVDKRE